VIDKPIGPVILAPVAPVIDNPIGPVILAPVAPVIDKHIAPVLQQLIGLTHGIKLTKLNNLVCDKSLDNIDASGETLGLVSIGETLQHFPHIKNR
jgi:hypothetical protein